MTNFNTLQLADKLKQAELGDIVVTDSGARLPFVSMYGDGFCCAMTKERCRMILEYGEITDIIRPNDKKEVPEIVRKLRYILDNYIEDKVLLDVIGILIIHFEKEAMK